MRMRQNADSRFGKRKPWPMSERLCVRMTSKGAAPLMPDVTARREGILVYDAADACSMSALAFYLLLPSSIMTDRKAKKKEFNLCTGMSVLFKKECERFGFLCSFARQCHPLRHLFHPLTRSSEWSVRTVWVWKCAIVAIRSIWFVPAIFIIFFFLFFCCYLLFRFVYRQWFLTQVFFFFFFWEFNLVFTKRCTVSRCRVIHCVCNSWDLFGLFFFFSTFFVYFELFVVGLVSHPMRSWFVTIWSQLLFP